MLPMDLSLYDQDAIADIAGGDCEAAPLSRHACRARAGSRAMALWRLGDSWRQMSDYVYERTYIYAAVSIPAAPLGSAAAANTGRRTGRDTVATFRRRSAWKPGSRYRRRRPLQPRC